MSLSRAKVRQACSQPPSKMGSFPTSGFLSSDTVPPWAQHPPGNASQLACETRGQGRQLEHGAHVACFAWSSKSFVFAPEVSCLLPALMGLRAGCQLPGGVEAQTAHHGSNPPCCWEREMPGCAGLWGGSLNGGWNTLLSVAGKLVIHKHSEFPPRTPAVQRALGPGVRPSILSGCSGSWDRLPRVQWKFLTRLLRRSV